MNQLEFINYIAKNADIEQKSLKSLGTGLCCTNGEVVFKVFEIEIPKRFEKEDIHDIFNNKLSIMENVYRYGYAPKLIHYYYDSKYNFYVLATEFLKGYITSAEYVEKYINSIAELNEFTNEVSKVISKLLNNYIDHGDTNTSNILINPDDSSIKLIDFETSFFNNELDIEYALEDLVETINEFYFIFFNKNKPLKNFLDYFYKRETNRDIIIKGNNQFIINNLGHLIEECVELRQLYPRKYWKENEDVAPINEKLSELSDIFIMWCIQAYSMDVSPFEVINALEHKIQYNNKRLDHAKIK